MTNSLHENLIGEDLQFAHPKWGEIYVRNKRPAVVNSFAPDRIVVLQHGATYGSAAFDVRSWPILDGLPRGPRVRRLLPRLAGLRALRSPPQISEPAEENPPFMRTPDAAECLGFICDRIRARRDVLQVCLIGHSWGCAITASMRPDTTIWWSASFSLRRAGTGPAASDQPM